MSFMTSFAVINLEIFKLMFFLNYLTIKDIKDICYELMTNDEDNKNIIKIYVKDNFMENEVERLLTEFFNDKKVNVEVSRENLIMFVLSAINDNKVSFLDGLQLIVNKLLEQDKSKKIIGDYIGLSEIIGVYYGFYEEHVTEKEKDELLIKGRELLKQYLYKMKGN